MAYYGYDPSKYIKDYTWISRELNPIIAKFASQVPELIETNKIIKENKRFKEMSWDAANQYLDGLEDEKLTKIASALELDYNDAADAREKLRSMLPKYGEKSTNEEYANQMVNSFFVPFINAARSEKGGGSLSWGDLITLKSGVLQDAIRKTAVGQQMTNEDDYALQQKRQASEFETKRQQASILRKDQAADEWGDGGIAEQRFKKTQELNDAYKIKQNTIYAAGVDQIMEDDLVQNKNQPLTLENISGRHYKALINADKYAAAHKIDPDILREKINQEFARQRQYLRDAFDIENADIKNEIARDRLNQQSTKDINKPFDKSTITKEIDAINNSINSDMIRIENKNLNLTQTEKDEIKRNINKKNIQKKIQERLLEKKITTVADYNKAMETVPAEVYAEEEKKFIETFNTNVPKDQGGFYNPGILGLGKGYDMDEVINEYKAIFGKPPIIKDGKIIPQFSYGPGVSNLTDNSGNTSSVNVFRNQDSESSNVIKSSKGNSYTF